MTNYAPLATTLLVLALCGCSAAPKERFYHRFHRLKYRLTNEEIKGLQFYLSSELLARTKSPPDVTVPTASGVIIVPRDTPGVATHVGRDWIKIMFRKRGTGVVFSSGTIDPNDVYLLYSLATAVKGTDTTIRNVADVPGHILIHDGVSYTVAEGYNAFLMVDGKQLQKLIDKRKLGAGIKK